MASKTNEYIGTFASDVAADGWLTANAFPKNIGLYYQNTGTNYLRFWDGTQWTELAPGGGGGPAPTTNAGNPNTVLSGTFGQLCLDTSNSIWYVCDSTPTGMVWRVI